MHHILSYLDVPALAALVQTSFASLQEASSSLYRDVRLSTVLDILSFTCNVSASSVVADRSAPFHRRRLRANAPSSRLDRVLFSHQPPMSPRSRLAAHLSISQTRHLTIHCPPYLRPVDIFPHLISRSTTFVPPRLHPLRSPLPLSTLTLTSFEDNNSSSDNHPFALLLLVLFPHLAPEKVQFWARTTEDASKLDRTHLWCTSFSWGPVMRAWAGSLRSLSAVGWYPLLADEDWFLLHYLHHPTEPDGRPFELELNLERWSEDLDDGIDVATMQQVGLFDREGLRAVFVVSKVGVEAVKREMEVLSDVQRARVELRIA